MTKPDYLTEGGFDTPQQVQRCLAALARGTLPSRFIYVGAAAKTHNAFALTAPPARVALELDLELACVKAAWGQALPAISTIIDIGSGNGRHAAALMRRMHLDEGLRAKAYIAVDYSIELADMACRELRAAHPDIATSSVSLDLENVMPRALLAADVSESMHLFLGNTLGNVENVDEVILHLRELVASTGRLLVSCALFDSNAPSESYTAPYNSNEYKRGVAQPMVMLGVADDAMQIDVRMHRATRTVITTMTFQREVEVEAGSARQRLLAGTAFRCFQSRRFERSELPALFAAQGFRVDAVQEDLDARLAAYAFTRL